MKKAIIIVSAAVVALGAGAYWYLRPQGEPDTSNDSSVVEPAPSRLSEEDAANKQQYIENSDNDDTPTSSNTGQTGNSPTSASVSISAKQQGSEVIVTSKLYGIGDGSCKVTATNGDKFITKTADVIYQPAYSTCAGFSLDTSVLGSGAWSIKLTATSLKKASVQAITSLEVN